MIRPFGSRHVPRPAEICRAPASAAYAPAGGARQGAGKFHRRRRPPEPDRAAVFLGGEHTSSRPPSSTGARDQGHRPGRGKTSADSPGRAAARKASTSTRRPRTCRARGPAAQPPRCQPQAGPIACSTGTAITRDRRAIASQSMRLSDNHLHRDRRSDDGRTILECIRTGHKSCPDLVLLVDEARGVLGVMGQPPQGVWRGQNR
jgi:hypothetical protein